MPTTDEELARKREHVQKLRNDLAAAEAQRVQRERESANDVTAAQLDAEAAQLEAQLAVANESKKVAAVKSGASSVLDSVKADQKAAAAQAKAQADANETKEG